MTRAPGLLQKRVITGGYCSASPSQKILVVTDVWAPPITIASTIEEPTIVSLEWHLRVSTIFRWMLSHDVVHRAIPRFTFCPGQLLVGTSHGYDRACRFITLDGHTCVFFGTVSPPPANHIPPGKKWKRKPSEHCCSSRHAAIDSGKLIKPTECNG